MDRETFRQELEQALAQVRDVVRLRVMELSTVLVPNVSRSRRGWELSRFLLQALYELRPDADEPDGWVRQRYEILSLRYANGLPPNVVADRLSITRRHFYRLLQRALDELADLLWANIVENRHDETGEILAEKDEDSRPDPARERLELLRQETARLAPAPQRTSVYEVTRRSLSVLYPMVEAHGISVINRVSPSLPPITVRAEILRQVLLGLLADLCQDPDVQSVSLTGQVLQGALRLSIVAQKVIGAALAGEAASTATEVERPKVSAELAKLQGVDIQIVESATDTQIGLTLPIAGARMVLVVDDNEEVCSLLQRYLASSGYSCLAASNGADAIALARSRELYAVTLDLMMSNEDGWDVLQTLKHDPATASLPIIVCSVLDQEELARILGASAFLRKPVMRDALLQALVALDGSAKDSETP